MSYDIDIVDDNGNVIWVDEKHQIAGGTYCVGGTSALTLNITYNYAPYFYRAFGEEGIRSLYGKRVLDTVGDIARAIVSIHHMADIEAECRAKMERHAELYPKSPMKTTWNPDDYWCPTRENAKKALHNLLALAALAPEGKWDGD